MPTQHDEAISRPLANLGRLIARKELSLKTHVPAPRPSRPLSPQKESEIFNKAMVDVTPLSFNRHWQWPKHPMVIECDAENEEQQAIDALCQLIETGQGFSVADTSEYMEAVSPGTHSLIARHLHQGRFSVQDFIDLHGLTRQQAKDVLLDFVRNALRQGKRAVLVVHGRGLTSPNEPVLKNQVYQWLTRGPLRKHVIAFTSARSCDGGAGATYVLLRTQPMTKKFRIKKKDV